MDEGIFWGFLAAVAAVVAAFLLARRFLFSARGAAAAEGYRPSREGASARNRVRVAARSERPPLPVFEPPKPPVIQGPGRPLAAGLFSGDTPLLLMQPVREIERDAFRETGEKLAGLELPLLTALSFSDKPLALPLPEGVEEPVPARLIEVALPQVGEIATDDLVAVGFGEAGQPLGTPAPVGNPAGFLTLAWTSALKASMERSWLPLALKEAAAREAARLECVSLAFSPVLANDWTAALGFLKQALTELTESDSESAALLSARGEMETKARFDALLAQGALTPQENRRLWREYGAILEIWRAALPVQACGRIGLELLTHAEAAYEKALSAFLQAKPAAPGNLGLEAAGEEGEKPAGPDPLEAGKERASEGISGLFSALDRSVYAMSLVPRFAIREEPEGYSLLRLDATAEGFGGAGREGFGTEVRKN